MRRILASVVALTLAIGFLSAIHTSAQVPSAPVMIMQHGDGPVMSPGPEGRSSDFATATRGAKEHDGYFKLYQKDDRVLMEIRPDQMGKPVLCPIAVAKGGGIGGHTLNFDEQWVLVFEKLMTRCTSFVETCTTKRRPALRLPAPWT